MARTQIHVSIGTDMKVTSLSVFFPYLLCYVPQTLNQVYEVICLRSFILAGWQFREKVALVLPSFFTFISSQCLCYPLKIGWQNGNSKFYPSDHKIYRLFTVLHFSCFIHTLVCRKCSIFSIIRFVSQVSLWYTSIVCITMLVYEMVQCSNSHLSA